MWLRSQSYLCENCTELLAVTSEAYHLVRHITKELIMRCNLICPSLMAFCWFKRSCCFVFSSNDIDCLLRKVIDCRVLSIHGL